MLKISVLLGWFVFFLWFLFMWWLNLGFPLLILVLFVDDFLLLQLLQFFFLNNMDNCFLLFIFDSLFVLLFLILLYLFGQKNIILDFLTFLFYLLCKPIVDQYDIDFSMVFQIFAETLINIMQ